MAKQKFRFANEVRKIIYFLLANGCYAFAIQLFLAGNNIAAGGFSGIAIVLSSFLPAVSFWPGRERSSKTIGPLSGSACHEPFPRGQGCPLGADRTIPSVH